MIYINGLPSGLMMIIGTGKNVQILVAALGVNMLPTKAALLPVRIKRLVRSAQKNTVRWMSLTTRTL